jgi:hypothetical protein
MATQLFLLNTDADCHLGANNQTFTGAAVAWEPRALGTARGSGVVASFATQTSTGPTAGNGIKLVNTNRFGEWISPPVSADVTISGTITANIWAAESSNSANVAINVAVDVIRANDMSGTESSNLIVRIATSARTTEVALTTRAVNNFTATPTSTVVNRGDRIRVRVFGDDAGTMATGFTFNIGYGGTTAAADGDTYVSFTETFSFESAPAGSQIFLTDTASDVATASVDREAWTSRGAGVQTDVTNTTTGWTVPLQVTDTAGGTVVDWFTKQLTAFTLGGKAVANIRASCSAATTASLRLEIARVASDGTSPTIWSSVCIATSSLDFGALTTSEVARTANLSGDDLAISDGQRLRFRIYLEDLSAGIMAPSQTVTTYYAGTSAAASGDTYITLPQSVTEFVSSTPGPAFSRQRRANRFLTSR